MIARRESKDRPYLNKIMFVSTVKTQLFQLTFFVDDGGEPSY